MLERPAVKIAPNADPAILRFAEEKALIEAFLITL